MDTKKLCLDATNTVAFDSTNSYLFNDASHLISTADNIAIKATGDNSIILDESFDGMYKKIINKLNYFIIWINSSL